MAARNTCSRAAGETAGTSGPFGALGRLAYRQQTRIPTGYDQVLQPVPITLDQKSPGSIPGGAIPKAGLRSAGAGFLVVSSRVAS